MLSSSLCRSMLFLWFTCGTWPSNVEVWSEHDASFYENKNRENFSGRISTKFCTSKNFLLYNTKFSWVFNFPPFVKILQWKFDLWHTHFSRSDCRHINGQHLRAKLPNLQDTLSKEILSKYVGIALLTAASLSGRQCDSVRLINQACMPRPYYITCAAYTCSEFMKLSQQKVVICKI